MQATSNRKHWRDARLIDGVIANLALMDGVSRHVVRALSEQATLIHASRGEQVIDRGEPVAGLFAIAYGSVKTRLLHANGQELVLGLLGPGSTFGEASALLGRPAKLSAAGISAQANRHPRLALNLANTLAQNTHALLLEFEQRMLPSLQRLAAYLQSIAEPADVPGTWSVRLPVSKTLLAARLGMKKETLSRLLRQLMARGLVQVEQRDIRILDRVGLARATALDRDQTGTSSCGQYGDAIT